MERISYYNKNIKVNRQALTEVYEILQAYEDSIEEIPEKYMYVIEDNRDKEYIFVLDDIENIELRDDTKKILTYLYTNFLSTPEERNVLKELEKMQYGKMQQQNTINTNVFEIKTQQDDKKIEQDLHPTVQCKENIFKRIFNFIKRIFR